MANSSNLYCYLLFLIFIGCSPAHEILQTKKTLIEIKVDSTEIEPVLVFLGNSDDVKETYACGSGSGSENSLFFYNKYGIVLRTKLYFPEKPGYKNGLIRAVNLFDTSNLFVRNSLQWQRYNGEEFFQISKTIVKQLFGSPSRIKKTKTFYAYYYPNRHLRFLFEKKSNKFIKLFIDKSKL